MGGESVQPVACNLGVTGKLIKQALTTRSAPPGFREALRRHLFGDLTPGQSHGPAREGSLRSEICT